MIHLKSNSTQIKGHFNKKDEKVNSDNDYIVFCIQKYSALLSYYS